MSGPVRQKEKEREEEDPESAAALQRMYNHAIRKIAEWPDPISSLEDLTKVKDPSALLLLSLTNARSQG